MTPDNYLVVGAGKMGGALLAGWLKDSVSGVIPEHLYIIDPYIGTEGQAAVKAGASHIESENKAMTKIDVVLIAIKPQAFTEIAPTIAPNLRDGALVISILAGTTMAALADVFPNQHIVRAMPNTPTAVGAGMTAFTCDSKVTERQARTAERLLKAGGKVRQVENEHMIDVVTAVSGSGPAYVFHMVEALEAAAVEAGMPADLAPEFARQTIIGAGALLDATKGSASEHRVAVTSPNGTTQAALDVLMPALPALMRETVKAALKRAMEVLYALSALPSHYAIDQASRHGFAQYRA